MTTRRLRPSELARQDQYEAWAADLAMTNPDAMVCCTSYSPPGVQCTWCDCPDDVLHHHPLGNVCPGCTAESYYAVDISTGGPTHRIPICVNHYPDLQRAVADRLSADASVEIHQIDILDK